MVSIIFLPIYVVGILVFILYYSSIMHKRIDEITKKEIQNNKPPFESFFVAVVFPMIIIYCILCFLMWLFKI